MKPCGYATEAARRVFADNSVWWRVVVLSVISLVPIVGAFLISGYGLVVMRDAAWGIERGLPRFSERHEILKRGLDGFVVNFVWTLPLGLLYMAALIGWIASSMPAMARGAAAPELPWWFVSALLLPISVLSIFLHVARLRTSVYLKASAGLSVRGVKRLISMNRDRFIEVAWLPVAVGLLGAVLSLPAALAMRDPDMPALVMTGLPYVSGFLSGLITMPVALMSATAYGLWGRDTNPAAWPPLGADTTIMFAEVRGQAAVGEDQV